MQAHSILPISLTISLAMLGTSSSARASASAVAGAGPTLGSSNLLLVRQADAAPETTQKAEGGAKAETKKGAKAGKKGQGKTAKQGKGKQAQAKQAEGAKAGAEDAQGAKAPAGAEAEPGDDAALEGELVAADESTAQVSDNVSDAFSTPEPVEDEHAKGHGEHLNQAAALLGLAIRAQKGGASAGMYQGLDYARTLPFGKPGMFAVGGSLGGIVGRQPAMMILATFVARPIERLSVSLGLGVQFGAATVPSIKIGDGDDEGDGGDDDEGSEMGDDDDGEDDEEGSADEMEDDGEDMEDEGYAAGGGITTGPHYHAAFLIRLGVNYGFNVGPFILGPNLDIDLAMGGAGRTSVAFTPGAFAAIAF